jgi:hypothetical protein
MSSDESTEELRAAVREFAKAWMEANEAKREAGELRNFLEQEGFSVDEAVKITDELQIYDIKYLKHLILEDLKELTLSDDVKNKLLQLAATTRDQHGGRPMSQNEYLVFVPRV